MARVSPGVVLVHKPVGVTSFSLVQELARELDAVPGKAHKLSHGGALDPFAEGVVLLLVGAATKLFEGFHEAPKTYEATVRWGVETDTGDPVGRVSAQGDARALTAGALDVALKGFEGWRAQVPPPTSNKWVDGERAYRRAHRGEAVELPPAQVYLHAARWLEHELPLRSRLRLEVRGGFYVRSLVRDLGRAVGARAHLETLKRVAIGPWETPASGERVVVSGPEVLPWYGRVALDDETWGRVKARASVTVRARVQPPVWRFPPGFPEPTPRVLGLHQGRVVALLEPRAEGLVPSQVLLPPL
ncbi:MAG: tRNA pseudouridine(55) synthase TruB [Myxococcaceae bacterium]|jgi:tRNA pseudouridine55 synthase|nr:tRNA pseudouridine(55) synthase TruB [Myxococcaceae bacterium]